MFGFVGLAGMISRLLGHRKVGGRVQIADQWRQDEEAAGMVVDNVSLLELQAQGSSNTRVRLGLANTTHVILIVHCLQPYRRTA